MRNVFLAVFLVVVISFPTITNADDEPFNLFVDGERFSSAINLMLTASADGKRTHDMVVSYVVSKLNGSWEVVWDAVIIDSTNEGKVTLSVKHYSTREGSIRNVKVGRATASFDIVFSGFSSGEEMHIVVPKNEHFIPIPEIRASRLYPSWISKVTNSKSKVMHKEEWEPTDKITLSSRDVFGWPASAAEPINKK